MEVEEFLEHHGIRGQKWGLRNKHPSLDRVSRVARGTEIKNKQINKANRRRTYSGLVVGSISAVIGARVIGGMTLSAPLSAIAGTGSAIAGYKFTKRFLENDANSTNNYLSKAKLR